MLMCLKVFSLTRFNKIIFFNIVEPDIPNVQKAEAGRLSQLDSVSIVNIGSPRSARTTQEAYTCAFNGKT